MSLTQWPWAERDMHERSQAPPASGHPLPVRVQAWPEGWSQRPLAELPRRPPTCPRRGTGGSYAELLSRSTPGDNISNASEQEHEWCCVFPESMRKATLEAWHMLCTMASCGYKRTGRPVRT